MPSRRALAIVLLLALSACGGASEEPRGGSYGADSTNPDAPATTTTSASRAPTTTTSTRSANRGNAATTTSAPRATTIPRPVAQQHEPVTGPTTAKGPPGAYARKLLGKSSNAVVVDFISQAGAQLRAATADHLLAVLRRESQKDIERVNGETIQGNKSTWTSTDIANAADENAGAMESADRAVIHVLALRGSFQDAEGALGVAVRGDVFAVFVDQVARASTPLVPARIIEDAVTTHELGHLLGLVDLAMNRGRADPDHPGHSRNRGSVMYWAIEADVVAQVLGGPPPTEFDDEDRADLATLRNGG